jgi:hypothetical protein
VKYKTSRGQVVRIALRWEPKWRLDIPVRFYFAFRKAQKLQHIIETL